MSTEDTWGPDYIERIQRERKLREQKQTPPPLPRPSPTPPPRPDHSASAVNLIVLGLVFVVVLVIVALTSGGDSPQRDNCIANSDTGTITWYAEDGTMGRVEEYSISQAIHCKQSH